MLFSRRMPFFVLYWHVDQSPSFFLEVNLYRRYGTILSEKIVHILIANWLGIIGLVTKFDTSEEKTKNKKQIHSRNAAVYTALPDFLKTQSKTGPENHD